MRRQSYHHGDLPAALLRAGAELVEVEGADRLSLRSVARAAGVSANAPYRHFADKDDLLAALAEHGCADMVDRIAVANGQTARDRLVAVVQLGVQFALERPQMFRLMSGSVCSTRPSVRTAMDAVQAAIVRAVGLDASCDIEEATALCTGIWALTHGLSSLIVAGHVHPGSGEGIDAYVARVVRATVEAAKFMVIEGLPPTNTAQ
ncbi:TetR/AcrR family transcriptional regulator [Streptosporangium sp. G11]|uniref:TetR/AcrR family transcriptional regulator n=1 Tax=Streptosporangium sp. G11 TaxID=3436926 RepID=UPI003EC018BE